ncbi:MAG: glycosyltransferase [Tabrizicola sp.]
MQIWGHCRFSYFGRSDTGREIDTLDTAFAKLWHPVRMAVRFHLFETLLLPAIRAQTDPGFVFQIVTSTRMPDLFQERLDRVTADIPQLRILRSEETDLNRALHPAMLEAGADGSGAAVHFRVDDDDAVSVDYVARLRQAALRVDPGGMITFPTGVIGFLHEGAARHAPFQKHSIAIGLALVEPPGGRNPFRIQHVVHASRVPSFCDPTFPAYHYTLHSANNTAGYGRIFHLDTGEHRRIQRLMQQHPEFAEGALTTPAAEAALAAAFPHTTGEALRAAILRAGDPVGLAEDMGFPAEPFAPPLTSG